MQDKSLYNMNTVGLESADGPAHDVKLAAPVVSLDLARGALRPAVRNRRDPPRHRGGARHG